jgi:predicted Zn finger-like uncharacterized protein
VVIECQKCGTKFNIDETRIKDAGVKVRCSVCKNVFEAYPPVELLVEEAHVAARGREELGKKPEAERRELRDQEIDFDKLFEDSLEDLRGFEGEAAQDLEGPEEKEPEKQERPWRDVPPTAIKPDADEMYPDQAEVPSAIYYEKRPRKSHFLSVFLVIILLLVAATAAIFFWAPELIPDSLSILKRGEKPEAADVSARLLSFKDVTGSFVDSKKSGQLFVIRGLITNRYQKNRGFILVKGTILDDKGKVVKQKLAYAGNNLKLEDLKVLPVEEIDRAMENRSGINNINLNVASGASIPFMIVFGNLPDNLSEFTVEAVSSSPAK